MEFIHGHLGSLGSFLPPLRRFDMISPRMKNRFINDDESFLQYMAGQLCKLKGAAGGRRDTAVFVLCFLFFDHYCFIIQGRCVNNIT